MGEFDHLIYEEYFHSEDWSFAKRTRYKFSLARFRRGFHRLSQDIRTAALPQTKSDVAVFLWSLAMLFLLAHYASTSGERAYTAEHLLPIYDWPNKFSNNL